MLLPLLAIISSTFLFFFVLSEARAQHVMGHSLVAMALALVLAALNFFGVRRVGLGMAVITKGKPEAVQARYGKAFYVGVLIWTVCAGFLGLWMVRLLNGSL